MNWNPTYKSKILINHSNRNLFLQEKRQISFSCWQGSNLTKGFEDNQLLHPFPPVFDTKQSFGDYLGSRNSHSHFFPYSLGKRENFTIVDADHTSIALSRTFRLFSIILGSKGKILFVSTNPSYSFMIQKAGELLEQPYVHRKWVNGFLTNWKQMISSKQTFENSSTALQSSYEVQTSYSFQIRKWKKIFEGLKGLQDFPQALIVINPSENINAIREAKKCNIPVIAFLHPNENPRDVDYPIPVSENTAVSIYSFLNRLIYLSQKQKQKIRRFQFQYNFCSSLYSFRYSY